MSDHAAHNLPPAARDWAARAIGAQATIRTVVRLPGATSSTLYLLTVAHHGREHRIVLRLFTLETWLAAEPDLPHHEAAALEAARAARIATPELIAVEPSGDICGVPMILMTHVPGEINLMPDDWTGWLDGLAAAAAAIHAVAAPDFGWHYAPYTDLSALDVPRWSARPALWRRAIALVQGLDPSEPERRFIHRDFHPVNVLWQGGRPAVVDWPNACLGPAHVDLSHCRANLAQLYGVEVADGFLAAYQRRTGSTFEWNPVRDILGLIDMIGADAPPGVYPGWTAYGIRGLSDALIRERVETYLAHLIARC
ncbi:MAG: hypothetical protein Kow0077_12590 [Anaerolineae bacterium]